MSSFKMAAVAFGLLVVVLLISGTHGFQPLSIHDKPGKYWSDLPALDFKNYRDYWLHHRYMIDPDWSHAVEQESDHKHLPNGWVSSKRDFANKFRFQAPFAKASSSPSSSTNYETLRPVGSRNGLFPEASYKPRQTVTGRGGSGLSFRGKENDDDYEFKRGSASVSYNLDVKPKNDARDVDLTSSALHAAVPSEGNETGIVTGERDNNLGDWKEATSNRSEGTETTEIPNGEDKTEILDETTDKVATAITPNHTKKTENPDSEEETSTITTGVNEITETTDGQKEKNEIIEDEEVTNNSTEKERLEITTDQEKKTGDPEVTEKVIEVTTLRDIFTEETLATNSRSFSTTVSPENSPDDTTETADRASTSISIETTPFDVDVTSAIASETDADVNPSTTNAPVSHTYSPAPGKITDATRENSSPTYPPTESKSSTSGVTTERVIDMPKIRNAKIAVSAAFLVIGLIAVAVMAACIFREKRRAVKYDQLKLLP